MKPSHLFQRCGLFTIASFAWITQSGCKPQDAIERDRAAAAQQEMEANKKPALQAQKAEVGVGVKGDSLDDIGDNSPGSLIAAPAKALFKTKERVVFEIQLPQMMNLYKATNGFAPKSHEEYMNEVQANRIQLPQLPEGMQYRYRPDVEELWVEPIAAPANP